jgi:leader peptidase (prepilin peptidase)/N-methyltransferase
MYSPIYLVFVFIFGLIVGSFLNVFILRRSTGKTVGGRSQCNSCGHKLSAIDLVPLFSFLFLKGRCRYCKAKISKMYPLVEFGTGLIFLLIFINTNIQSMQAVLMLVVSLLFWTLAFAISIYDLRHTIIPNPWVFSLSVIAVFYSVISYWNNVHELLLSILSGIIFSLFFFALWLFSRGKWMGLGDAKFALALGVFIGLPKLFSAWALSFWIGAISVLLYFLIDSGLNAVGKRLSHIAKPITMKSEVPFGPFLFLGSFLAFVGLLLPIYGL